MIKILKEIKLEQYIELFEKEGIDSIEDFLDYEDEDLLELGIKKPHIKRLRRATKSENKNWNEFINDTDMWNKFTLESNIPIISHEYLRIKQLLSDKMYFGVLLQIKDFLEILLKFPILIIINEKFNLKSLTDKEKMLIILSLDKPLSLGHWYELGNYIKKHKFIDDEELYSLIVHILKLYNKHNIIKWRNEEIGHGALSLENDKEFQKDIADKIKIIKLFLDNNIVIIKHLFERYINYISLPFFNRIDEKIYFFDTYLKRKDKTFHLNYCYGKKIVFNAPDFKNFLSSCERDENIEEIKISDIMLVEDEQKLEKLETITDFESPNYLIQWLNNVLNSFEKGNILLQMERGTGKTTFCKGLDQLSLNKINLQEDILIRSFYINDIYRYSLGDFIAEISYFILNKELQGNILVDKFKGKLPTLNNESQSSDLAYMLNWYKEKYNVEKLLLIIDGIDEIPFIDNKKTIFDILPSNNELDEGIYIMITSRTNEEITPISIEKLNSIFFINHQMIYKESLENIKFLQNFIKKSKNIDEKLSLELIKKADYKILYLNLLKEIIISNNELNIDFIESNEYIIDYYLKNIKNKYGDKYYESIFKLLCLLVSQFEELDIYEIMGLNDEAVLNLKLIANLFDLRSFIKKTRSERGNLFSINHIQLKNYFLTKYQNEIKNYIIDLYKNITFDANDGIDIYKIAYITKYESSYDLNLTNKLKSLQVLNFLLNIKYCNKRVVNIGNLLIDLMLKERKTINVLLDTLSKINSNCLKKIIESKLEDKVFVEFINNNIEFIKNHYQDSFYLPLKYIYIVYYKYINREISYIIQELLLKKHNEFDDILNYISMCKGDSKWNQAKQMIDKYIVYNNFTQLQQAHFYYIIGRMYVDDLENFEQSIVYLNKSIKIYEQLKNKNLKVVKNTLSMYMFSKGLYKEAYHTLLPIYKDIMKNGVDKNEIEAIFNNYYVYNMVNDLNFDEEIEFLNKEIYIYYLNNKSIQCVKNGKNEEALNLLKKALRISNIYNKNYAKAAVLYNQAILLNNFEKLKEVKAIVMENNYTIGNYIIDNFSSTSHVINTYSINNKNYWLCVKNIDLLL